MNTEHRVYAACLASYNNGILHGRWIDCTEGADHIREELADMLRESPEPNVRVECPNCATLIIPDNPDGTRRQGHPDCHVCGGSGTVPSAEEYAFHDFEGFPGSLHNEWESIDTLAAYAETVDALHSDEERDAFAHWYADFADHDHDARELEENFRDAYMGTFDDERDWAEQYVADTGLLSEVPENMRHYFDYEAYARDAFFELDGHHGDHGFHVFSNN